MDPWMEQELPLFQQIARRIEDGILSGAFPEGEQVPSTNEFSAQLKVNPATVLKGMNLLAQRRILEKRRGLGLFVAPGAQERLWQERREDFLETTVKKVLEEADRLGISRGEIARLIERG